MRQYATVVAIFFCLCFTSLLQAQEAPEVMLQRVTDTMIQAMRKHDQALKARPAFIRNIVENVLVPHVDWVTMSQWVLGRQIWLHATDAQKKQFIHTFKSLLIHSYAGTLRAYRNQSISYLPPRGGSGKSSVQVGSLIRAPGREPIHVTYRLTKKGQTWQVYDISIEGISLLKGFRSQFASELQRGDLDHLIRYLHAHNQKAHRS